MKSKLRARKPTTKYKPDPNDAKVLDEHMDELIEKYPGQYVVVAGGDLFIGRDPAKLDREARRQHPDVSPLGSPIPRKSDFFSVL